MEEELLWLSKTLSIWSRLNIVRCCAVPVPEWRRGKWLVSKVCGRHLVIKGFLFLLVWLLLCLCVYTEGIPLPMSGRKCRLGWGDGEITFIADLSKFGSLSSWLSCNFLRCGFLYSCVFLVSGKWCLHSVPWETRRILPSLSPLLRGETYSVSANCDGVSHR